MWSVGDAIFCKIQMGASGTELVLRSCFIDADGCNNATIR
jgi:hypothetical protein